MTKARVIHLIGGRFDGTDVVFYGKPPSIMKFDACDRLADKSGTVYEYTREYEYHRQTTEYFKMHIEYQYNCIGERETIDDVAG